MPTWIPSQVRRSAPPRPSLERVHAFCARFFAPSMISSRLIGISRTCARSHSHACQPRQRCLRCCAVLDRRGIRPRTKE
eukprot:2765934-Rhodomonas_salina.2